MRINEITLFPIFSAIPSSLISSKGRVSFFALEELYKNVLSRDLNRYFVTTYAYASLVETHGHFFDRSYDICFRKGEDEENILIFDFIDPC